MSAIAIIATLAATYKVNEIAHAHMVEAACAAIRKHELASDKATVSALREALRRYPA